MEEVYNDFVVVRVFCKYFQIIFYLLFFADNAFNYFKLPCFMLQPLKGC